MATAKNATNVRKTGERHYATLFVLGDREVTVADIVRETGLPERTLRTRLHGARDATAIVDAMLANPPRKPDQSLPVGARFGRLVLLGEAPKRLGRSEVWWSLRCDCGTERTARRHHVRNGATQSCGCLMRERRGGQRRQPVIDGKKLCLGCQERVPTEHFFRDEAGDLRARCKSCYSKDSRAWCKANPERHRTNFRRANHRVNVRKRFGLTVAEFDALFKACDGRCSICREPESRARRLSLDHDHGTGQLRGFLCCRCNLLLGAAKDDADRLERAAAYLRGLRPVLGKQMLPGFETPAVVNTVGVQFLPGFKNEVSRG
jgi:hypothetical protein